MQKTILIVEDDADLRISLRKILTANNFKVLEASDGAEALERVEKEHPDLVLLDFVLPVVSGETVCVKIKENHPEIVVIAVTEKALSSDVIHGLQVGADDYVSKPFVAEELVARIDARLRNKRENNSGELKSDSLKQEEYKLILRESIALIVLRLAAAELFFGVVFVLLSVWFSFAGTHFQIADTVGLSFLMMLIVLIVNIVVVLFIILKWTSEYSELTHGSLIRHSGILFKKEQKYACNFVEIITFEQSMLGLIFNYGTIELYDPAIKERIYLINISSPKKYREIIEKRVSKEKNQPMPFITQ